MKTDLKANKHHVAEDMGHNQSESTGQHPDLNAREPAVGPGAGVDIDSSAMPEDGIIDIHDEDVRESDDEQLDVLPPQTGTDTDDK